MKIRYTLFVVILWASGLCGAMAQQVKPDSIASDSIVSETRLDELEVIGYKKINKGDLRHQIFELDKKIVPNSFSVQQALRFVPGIVDTGGGYKIFGSDNAAQILIDGVAAKATEMAALSAHDIWRVEVIKGGIDGDRINIRRRRSLTHQFKGNLRARGALPASVSLYSGFTWQSPTFNVTLTPGGLLNRQEVESMQERKSSTEHSVWRRTSDSDVWQSNGTLRLNYYPNKRWDNTLVARYAGGGGQSTTQSSLNGQAPESLVGKDYSHILESHLVSKYSWSKSSLRLRGYLSFETERQDLSIGADLNQAKYRYRSLTGDLTYQMQLPGERYGQHKLSYYYALSSRQTRSVYEPMEHDRLVHTLRIGDELRLGERWSGDVLLSLQHDAQHYGTFTNRGWDLLPYVSMMYSGSHRDAFELSYYQTVSRPSGQVLDPTRYYTSDTEYTQGNPDISNERTHRVSLRYQKQIKGFYLTAGLAYKYEDNVIGRVYTLSDPNLRTWANVGNQSTTSLSLSLFGSLFQRKLSLNVSGTLGYTDCELDPQHRATSLSLGGQGLIYQGNLNLSYRTSKGWFYTLYTQWSGRSRDFSVRRDDPPLVYFDIDKDIIPQKLSLRFSLLNPWGAMKSHSNYLFAGMTQTQWSHHKSLQQVSLSLTYTFGKRFRTRDNNSTIEIDDRKNK